MKPRDYRDCVTVVTSEVKIVLSKTGNSFLEAPIHGASGFLRQSRSHVVTRPHGSR